MEATTELTQRGGASHGENLEQVKQDFTHWRKHHQRGTRIPTALWDAAVRMANEHGLEHTAQELQVDHERLKKRQEQTMRTPPHAASVASPQFVEIFASPAPPSHCACIVLLENARGAKMRIEFTGDHTAGLTDLASTFWNAP